MQVADRWKEKLEGWVVFGSPELVGAHAATRMPIRIVELLEDPPVVLRISEVDGGLQVSVTTEAASLADKTVEIRLAGETREARMELKLGAVSRAEWAGSGMIRLDEERLKDLDKCIISIRISDEEDADLDEFDIEE